MRRAISILTAVALTVALAGPAKVAAYTPYPPGLQMWFGTVGTTPSIPVGGSINLHFHLFNPSANTAELWSVRFTDGLPASLKVMNDSRTVCEGTLTVTKATGTVALAGAHLTLPGTSGATCDFDVQVWALSAGTITNSASADSTPETGPGGPDTATMTVWKVPTVTLRFSPTTVTVGAESTMDLLVFNPDDSHYLVDPDTVNVDISMPAGLAVVLMPGSACVGGTVGQTGSTIQVRGMGVTSDNTCDLTFTIRGTAAGTQTATATADIHGWAFYDNVKTADLTVTNAPTPTPPPAGPAATPTPGPASSATTSAPGASLLSGPSASTAPAAGSTGSGVPAESSEPSLTVATATAPTTTGGDSGILPVLLVVGLLLVLGILVAFVLVRRRRRGSTLPVEPAP